MEGDASRPQARDWAGRRVQGVGRAGAAVDGPAARACMSRRRGLTRPTSRSVCAFGWIVIAFALTRLDRCAIAGLISRLLRRGPFETADPIAAAAFRVVRRKGAHKLESRLFEGGLPVEIGVAGENFGRPEPFCGVAAYKPKYLGAIATRHAAAPPTEIRAGGIHSVRFAMDAGGPDPLHVLGPPDPPPRAARGRLKALCGPQFDQATAKRSRFYASFVLRRSISAGVMPDAPR